MSVERELAVHETEIKHLQNDMDKIVSDMEDIKKTLQSINSTLSEARGGWKFLLLFGGAGGTVGSLITWFIQQWGSR
jgi:prefoldin subunit 5